MGFAGSKVERLTDRCKTVNSLLTTVNIRRSNEHFIDLSQNETDVLEELFSRPVDTTSIATLPLPLHD